MPELPEVETTRRGIEPYLAGARILGITVRNRALRWPVPVTALEATQGAIVKAVQRRAKYLLWQLPQGAILLHLGMSGSLRVVNPSEPVGKHDHIDFRLQTADGQSKVLRFNDPRRFGCCLWITPPVMQHPLLAKLGPEPLSSEFDGEVLYARSRRRKVALKNFIMSGNIVVGVGNIYASEALYLAGIRPGLAAKSISRVRYQRLAAAIKEVLTKAIAAGGTTLNDFTQSDGQPGYFKIELQVYGRAGEACKRCHDTIKQAVHGQRSTYYCPSCQS